MERRVFLGDDVLFELIAGPPEAQNPVKKWWKQYASTMTNSGSAITCLTQTSLANVQANVNMLRNNGQLTFMAQFIAACERHKSIYDINKLIGNKSTDLFVCRERMRSDIKSGKFSLQSREPSFKDSFKVQTDVSNDEVVDLAAAIQHGCPLVTEITPALEKLLTYIGSGRLYDPWKDKTFFP